MQDYCVIGGTFLIGCAFTLAVMVFMRLKAVEADLYEVKEQLADLTFEVRQEERLLQSVVETPLPRMRTPAEGMKAVEVKPNG